MGRAQGPVGLGAALIAAAALLIAACDGGGPAVTPTPLPLTAQSPRRGGPGGSFEYCDGPICATNGGIFQEWEDVPLKVLWRVEEEVAGETLALTGASADGRYSLDQMELGRAIAPDDLPGYHYFPSGLEFFAAGVWVLTLDTGSATGEIVVEVTPPVR